MTHKTFVAISIVQHYESLTTCDLAVSPIATLYLGPIG